MRKHLLGVILAMATATCMLAGLTGCNSEQSTYTPEPKEAAVTTPTIGVDGTLRVGVDTTNPPMAGQTTKIVGIDVDLAAALADELGLKVEVVDVGTSALSSLQNGTVDIVMGMDTSNTDSAIWKSNSYIQTGTVLFATDANAAVPTSESKIAAQSTSMSAWNITSEYGSDALVNATDLSEAFTKLGNGEVNYVACDGVMGTYVAYTAGVQVYPIALESSLSGYSVGVLNTNTALTSLISQYMTQLSSTGIVGIVENKWLGTTIDFSTLKMTDAATKAAAAKTTETTDTKTETTTE